jgi:hypothetical protein
MASAPDTVVETEVPAAAAADDTNPFDPLDDDLLDLPPLRIHSKHRLSASSLQIPPGIQNQMSQKRYSLDSKTPLTSASPTGVGSLASSIASRRGRSRSRSPSLRSRDGRHAHHDSNASLSSLEDIVDPDILLDKMGFVDIAAADPKNPKLGSSGGHNSYNALTPVPERMSEDTLEDVHAFSDWSANTNTRPSSSVGTGGSTVGGEVSSHVLEPLYEGEDDDLESEDDADLKDEERPSQVILTNLEKITLKNDA